MVCYWSLKTKLYILGCWLVIQSKELTKWLDIWEKVDGLRRIWKRERECVCVCVFRCDGNWLWETECELNEEECEWRKIL